jgi:bifunctional DNase/RNase
MRTWRRLGGVGVLLLVLALLTGARAQSSAPPAANGVQEVTVVGLFLDPRTEQPTVVLQGKRDKRAFAMVIGAAEATGIAVPLQNITPPRPLTHDLFLTLFGRLKVALTKVVITDLREHTYYAVVYLSVNGAAMELDSRPSDAIALAIRAKAPIYAEDRVFHKAPSLPLGTPGPGPRI